MKKLRNCQFRTKERKKKETEKKKKKNEGRREKKDYKQYEINQEEKKKN